MMHNASDNFCRMTPLGTQHFSAASRGNTGDGMRMGESLGAVVATELKHASAMAPVSLVPQPDGSMTHFSHLIERGKPGLIAVTRFGKRFVNEADSYHDFMQGLLQALPDRRVHSSLAGRGPPVYPSLGPGCGQTCARAVATDVG